METTTRTGPLGRAEKEEPGTELGIVWFEAGVVSEGGVLAHLRDGLVIGRGDDADCILRSPQVSRRHARVEAQNGALILRDLNSKNGVFVNARRASVSPLADQDVVRLGNWVGVVSWVSGDTRDFDDLFESVEGGGGALFGARTRKTYAEVRRVASSGLRVMLVGETGTGKEVFANELHRLSGRSGSLVAVNCAAIPEQLAEAELFGFRRGAFTGADRSHLGHFRTAHTGTLFLDEIGELPLTVQAKMLRVLEERRVVPLGQSTVESAEARVVCASQTPLHEKVEEGAFRADLYARLNGLELNIPPLRARREEVLPIMHHSAKQIRRPAKAFDTEAIEQLCLYDWPLNVRELRQLHERLWTMNPNEKVIRLEHLSERIATFVRPTPSVTPRKPRASPSLRSGGDWDAPARVLSDLGNGKHPRDELAQRLVGILRESHGNVSVAAERMGISRPRAYRLLQRIPEIELEAIRLEANLTKARDLSEAQPPGSRGLLDE